MKNFGQRKYMKLSAQDGKLLYEGHIVTDDRNKQPVYDGAGYLFNNDTKCFFKGTWQAGEKLCGIETFPNGDVYEGGYLDGKFNGMGLMYNNVRGSYRYEGYFQGGQRNGQGKEQYITGGSYEGTFKNNFKHGQGILKFNDGSYFMGEFQRGFPNGFGIHIAYSKHRIVSIFPLQQKSEDHHHHKVVPKETEITDLEKNRREYAYEGDFVDGYKHGIGRLSEPSGSYFYGYWEYNKPVRDFVYYEADGNKWKLLNIKEMSLNTNINFYEVLEESDWRKQPYKSTGYPANQYDGYKCMIDEKGLKREHLEDPEFDFQEVQMMIRDENGSPAPAPVDYRRIFTLDLYKKSNYRLFNGPILPGYLIYSEQYCCQQLTTILDAMTFHSYLFQKIITRKYEAEIGFYIIKLFIANEWREVILDDSMPVFKTEQVPVFSNSPNQDLAFALIFKAFAKLNGAQLNYFENDKLQKAQDILTMLTGMPSKLIKFTNEIKNEDYSDKQLKLWRQMTEKYQKTQMRICYLNREQSSRLLIPINYAFHIVDSQVAPQAKRGDESHFLLLKSSLQRQAIKTDANDPYYLDKLDKHSLQAINKLKERNPQLKEDQRYFFIAYKDFLRMFENVVVLAGTKYPIQNQLLMIPEEDDKYNNESRFFCKFALNLPSSLLITVTQQHLDQPDENGKVLYSKEYVPVRIVLAKEKDLFTNKSQIKKKVAAHWTEKILQTKQDKAKQAKQQVDESVDVKAKFTSIMPITQEQKKEKPYKYVFGRGQQAAKHLFKDCSLESGMYLLFIQTETGDGKESIPFENLRFWLTIHAQCLVQIQKVPMITGFQKAVYESAIQQADKQSKDLTQQPKFYHKGDLSEQENGSSDLVITQYFLKKEGTYLQFLHNRSTNKIWRQKLYFRTENMVILDQRDNAKLDLQLSKKETALVIIQQVGAKPYNLEGGEGICIVDLLNDQKDDGEFNTLEDGENEHDDISKDGDDQAIKPKFLDEFNKHKN